MVLCSLLPHGYEGQGPEHSSARLERYLQLCAKHNMFVACPTSPASLFHILRRQLSLEYRKPLIIMSPKSMLRHKMVTSSIKEFDKGTKFKPLIAEVDKSVKKVKRVLLCTGKVYYDLYAKREELKRKDVAIIRLEQLYPFPNDETVQELVKYPGAEIIWVQEEQRNMGAYFFVEHRMKRILKELGYGDINIGYVGRGTSASPAAGYMSQHVEELQRFLTEAFE